MSRRKLSERQHDRVQQQRERARRGAQSAERAEQQLSGTDLGDAQHGQVVARFGAQVIVEGSDGSHAGQRQRCHLRTHLGHLVAGDRVIWRPGPEQGVVTADQPRSSVLERPDSRGLLHAMAANIDRLLVVIAPQPEAFANLIDRYLVAAETAAIAAVLVLNKCDLLPADGTHPLTALLARYRHIGYPTLAVSSHSGLGMDALQAALCGHTAIITGQSGVGKSSLVNALLGSADARVGALSAAADKGRHTTSMAELFHLPGGGLLIDSPGIREFGLGHVSPVQLARGFREFRPWLDQCRFRDCSHTHEPGCAIIAATESGAIAAERLHSYRQILLSLA